MGAPWLCLEDVRLFLCGSGVQGGGTEAETRKVWSAPLLSLLQGSCEPSVFAFCYPGRLESLFFSAD